MMNRMQPEAGLEAITPGAIPVPLYRADVDLEKTPASVIPAADDCAPIPYHQAVPGASAAESAATNSGLFGAFKTKKKRLWIWIFVIVVVVVGAMVGGAVGGTVGRRGNGSASRASSDGAGGNSSAGPLPASGPRGSTSACRGGVCPATIQVVRLSGTETRFVFALTANGSLAYRAGSTADHSSVWDTPWVDLGGTFAYPVGVATRLGKYIEAFGVGSDAAMYWRSYYQGAWTPSWYNLGGSWASAPTALSWHSDGSIVDRFGLRSDGALGQYWSPVPNSGLVVPQNSYWDGGFLRDGSLVGTLSAAVREPGYDGFMRTINNSLYSFTWGVEGSTNLGGILMSSPTAVSSKSGSLDVFALGAGGHPCWRAFRGVWLEWVCVDEIAMESIVSAVVLGANRVDVVALGRNDHVYHRSLVDQTWGATWDDLGGPLNGAPVVASFRPNRATVFGLGLDARVYVAEWDSGGFAWTGNTSWTDLGGNFRVTLS